MPRGDAPAVSRGGAPVDVMAWVSRGAAPGSKYPTTSRGGPPGAPHKFETEPTRGVAPASLGGSP